MVEIEQLDLAREAAQRALELGRRREGRRCTGASAARHPHARDAFALHHLERHLGQTGQLYRELCLQRPFAVGGDVDAQGKSATLADQPRPIIRRLDPAVAEAEPLGDTALARVPALAPDAASPALVLPFLRGNESVRLEGVLPGGNSIVVRLPGDAPRVRLRHGGQDHDWAVRPHRVLISTIELGVYIVWHAAFYPPQPLPLNPETFEPRRGKELEGILLNS